MDFVKSEKWLRRLVIAYNVFFWVTGPGIVGLGVWMFIALGKNEPVVVRDDFADPCYVIIVAGVLSVIAGILGCLGGVNEHTKLLNGYFFLMFAVCALEVTATVLSFTLYDKMESKIEYSMQGVIGRYYTNTKGRSALDDIQQQYTCCGLTGPNDWIYNATVSTARALPSSCCPDTVGLEPPDVCGTHIQGVYVKGCLDDVVAWTRQKLIIGGWTVFAMACTQLLALAVICCFTKAVSLLFLW